jgi:hypothetical protein
MADEYSRTLSHAFLTGVVQEFKPSEDMLGPKIFRETKVMGAHVGIDIEKFPRTLPKYRHPGAEAGKNALMTVKHIDVTLPCLRERVDIDADTLNIIRQPGTEHQAWGRVKMATEAQKIDILLENRREKSRFDLLTTGIVTQALAKAGDIAFSIDFGIPATPNDHTPTLTSTAVWTAPTTATPHVDFRNWKKIYAQDSGKNAKVVIMNSTTMNLMIECDSLQALMGEQFKSDLLRVGWIERALSLEFWVYDLGYVSGSTFYPFVPDNKVILWSGDPLPEYVGLAPEVDATSPGKFAKTFKSEDPSGVALVESVRALPSGERVNELFCATVV